MKKIIVIIGLAAVLLVGGYYGAWIKTEQMVKTEIAKTIDLANASLMGIAKIEYETISTAGIWTDTLSFSIDNLTIKANKSLLNKDAQPFLATIPSIRGNVPITGHDITLLLSGDMSASYHDPFLDKVIQLKTTYEQAPEIHLLTTYPNWVPFKKMLLGQANHFLENYDEIKSLELKYSGYKSQVTIEGENIPFEKIRSGYLTLSAQPNDPTAANKLAQPYFITMDVAVKDYEMSNEYIQYLIDHAHVPMDKEIVMLGMQINKMLGAMSSRFNIAYNGPITDIQNRLMESQVEIKEIGFTSQLGGLRLDADLRNVLSGQAKGQIAFIEIEKLFYGIADILNITLKSDAWKTIQMTIPDKDRFPFTSIEKSYVKEILAVLQAQGKQDGNTLLFDYEMMPNGEGLINGQPAMVLLMAMSDSVSQLQEKAMREEQAAQQAKQAAEALAAQEATDKKAAEEWAKAHQKKIMEEKMKHSDEEMNAGDMTENPMTAPMKEGTMPMVEPKDPIDAQDSQDQALSVPIVPTESDKTMMDSDEKTNIMPSNESEVSQQDIDRLMKELEEANQELDKQLKALEEQEAEAEEQIKALQESLGEEAPVK